MLEHLVRFVGLFCLGLAAGIAVCVLLTDRIQAGTGQFYTELMQLLNRALTVPAPALGALGLVAMSADSVLLFERGGGAAFWVGVAAALLNLVALGLTRFGHFPINAQIFQWSPASPPAHWARVQMRWSALHFGRTCSAVGSFALFLLGNSLSG